MLGSSHADRLFEALLQDYNPLVRPVHNHSLTLTVKLFLRLSMLLKIHEKNQVMTTNLWLRHEWKDYNLQWKPEEYGGIQDMTLEPDTLWKPDIVLYNNADGYPAVTLLMSTKAKVKYTGEVTWEPPATYRSFCPIDVKWFPYDEQICLMKFGTWSYDGSHIDLEHWKEKEDVVIENVKSGTRSIVRNGLDLTDYHRSHEWSIMAVPATRNAVIYPCCEVPFIDITVELHLRRKPLFYTVNLMAPTVCLAFLTVLVFHLPSDSWEKMTLSISILISITVFFLMLVDLVPATSLTIPLIARYLLFTLILVFISVMATSVSVDYHWRKSSDRPMSKWMHKVLLKGLPPLLAMKPLQTQPIFALQKVVVNMVERCLRKDSMAARTHLGVESSDRRVSMSSSEGGRRASMVMRKQKQDSDTLAAARYIASSVALMAHKLRRQEMENETEQNWKYSARIIDRFLLIVFCLAFSIGTLIIIIHTPALYDNQQPIA